MSTYNNSPLTRSFTGSSELWVYPEISSIDCFQNKCVLTCLRAMFRRRVTCQLKWPVPWFPPQAATVACRWTFSLLGTTPSTSARCSCPASSWWRAPSSRSGSSGTQFRPGSWSGSPRCSTFSPPPTVSDRLSLWCHTSVPWTCGTACVCSSSTCRCSSLFWSTTSGGKDPSTIFLTCPGRTQSYRSGFLLLLLSL